MGIKNLLINSKMFVGKHSPAILMIGGILGVGATIYLTYKSAPKVEKILYKYEDILNDESRNVIDRKQLVIDLGKELYLPIIVSTVSIGMILASYKIMNNRILGLSTVLAATKTEREFFKEKIKTELGEEILSKYEREIDEGPLKLEMNKKGQEVLKEDTRSNSNIAGDMYGRWFEDSQEYQHGDHDYNSMYIAETERYLQNLLTQKGSISLNQVLSKLGFAKTKYGSTLGWSLAGNRSFGLEQHTIFVKDDNGELYPTIRVRWGAPDSLYNEYGYYDGLSLDSDYDSI